MPTLDITLLLIEISWPGGNGITSEKVPSEFTYDMRPVPEIRNLHRSDSLITLTSPFSKSQAGLKPVRWGYQVKPGEQRVKCIKLFLDRNQELPKFVKDFDVALYLRNHGREVVDAVGDFLVKVHQHTLDTLRKRYGEAFMNSTRVRFVLTVPAIWSDAARDATREAASHAGIKKDDIIMISEPEAAAVYTIKAIQPNHLHIGDNIVVCDAGGGTVDLISYKIAQLAPLGIEEAQVGTGGLCGSAFLNYGFEEHVKFRIGEVEFSRLQSTNPAAWETALKHFEEYVKRNLSDELEDFNIPMPGVPDNDDAGVSMGYLALSHEEVSDIFKPIVKQILNLIEEQVNAIHSSGGQVSAILLVGGFGQSGYLHARVKSHFNRFGLPPPYSETLIPGNTATGNNALAVRAARSNRVIEVMQPPNAWTAVTRGAVIRGLEGSIALARMTRYHYGVTCSEIFDATKHSVERQYWDNTREIYRVADCMRWFVAKGTRLSVEQTISLPFNSSYKKAQISGRGPLIHNFTLWATGCALAPEAFHGSFLKVCTISTNLREIPRQSYQKCLTPSGKPYLQINFHIEMTANSASLGFCLKAGGKIYGGTTATYDH